MQSALYGKLGLITLAALPVTMPAIGFEISFSEKNFLLPIS
jgi:hypothetical protein